MSTNTIGAAPITPAELDKSALVKKAFEKNFSNEQVASATMDSLKILLVAVAFVIISLVIDKKD